MSTTLIGPIRKMLTCEKWWKMLLWQTKAYKNKSNIRSYSSVLWKRILGISFTSFWQHAIFLRWVFRLDVVWKQCVMYYLWQKCGYLTLSYCFWLGRCIPDGKYKLCEQKWQLIKLIDEFLLAEMVKPRHLYILESKRCVINIYMTFMTNVKMGCVFSQYKTKS